MALRFVLPLLAILGQTHSTQLHLDPHVLAAQTAAQSYKAGIAAAGTKQWDVAAERFREAIARDPNERAGYFPHYWLGVAYEELHETSKALAEWRESQRQGAIKGTPEEVAMKQRMSAHMHTSAHPTHIVLPPPLPRPPLPQPQPVPQPFVIMTHTSATTDTTTVQPTTTMTETEAMTTAAGTTTDATTTEHHHDPTTPEGQLFNEIDQSFKALNPGELHITAPHEMRVAVPQRFILRIAAANQTDGIDADLPIGGQTSTSKLHVTPTMRATLAGSGFTIQSTSDERQLIGGGSFTEWSWQVTPTESGDRELVANVYVELKGLVKGTPKRWPVHVSANTGQSVSLFFAKNWQWLSSTLLIPLVLFFWRQRKKQT